MIQHEIFSTRAHIIVLHLGNKPEHKLLYEQAFKGGWGPGLTLVDSVMWPCHLLYYKVIGGPDTPTSMLSNLTIGHIRVRVGVC